MATATVETIGGDILTVINIEPGGLDLYLKMVGDQPGNPKIKCYDGSILFVSPSPGHERAGERLDMLVKEISRVLRIRLQSFASTLYRVPITDVGFEPDRSYYIRNVDRVRGVREEIDLAVHPPPDLVIEVVVSHGPERSLGVSRALKVPEVWVYDVRAQSLRILHFRKSANSAGSYVAAERSRAFPFLTRADVAPWAVHTDEDDLSFVNRLHDWVKAKLAPRVRAAKGKGNAS
jgi:Uma2 family endonuclease